MKISSTTSQPPSIDRRHALVGLFATIVGAAGCSAANDSEADGSDPLDVAASTSPTPPKPASTEPTTTEPSAAPKPDQTPPERDTELHALRRLTYGPKPADIERVRALGVDGWVDEQLTPDSLDTRELDEQLAAAFPELAQSASTLLADYRADGNGFQIYRVLSGAAFARHCTSEAQLFERLVEFWGDHFNAPQVTPPATIARIEMDRDVLRRHAVGRFDDLLVAVAQSPAMLRFLDNGSSSVGAINENYARELLELHTMGAGSGYTEDDIISVARLLTGWGLTRDLTFRFAPRRHDAGAVSMLGWERPGDGDPFEHGVEFLRHIAVLPETARFVCRKLATRFVADQPDLGMVDAMAATWIDTGSEIGPVIRTMVGHPAFDQAPPKFNRPWDYYIQTLRTLDAELDVSSPRDLRSAIGAASDLGQLPFRWPSPDGYPDTQSHWLDPSALLRRWDLVSQLTDPDDETFTTNMRSLIEQSRGLNADDIASNLCERICLTPLSEHTRSIVARLTRWGPDVEPNDAELDEFVPHIVFVLLTSPSNLYR